jgi:hypothetical protein
MTAEGLHKAPPMEATVPLAQMKAVLALLQKASRISERGPRPGCYGLTDKGRQEAGKLAALRRKTS